MTIVQIYNSYYKHIPLNVFNATVAADPTSYNQGKVVKVGNFVKWILKLYQNNSWKSGDSYETKDLLSKFIKYKSRLPVEKRDINRFNSVSELHSLIQTLEGQGVKTQSEVKRDGAEVVYEDSEWKIVIPHTKEASCIYGAHTRWCTAGRENNMFDYYNDEGPLYININKVIGEKYQFHFESESFMDAEDEEILPRKIGLSEGVIDYYKSIGKELYFIYDELGDFYDGFAKVYKQGKGYNFINEQGELLWKGDEWFYDVLNFSEGFAEVKIEGIGWNFINKQGELLWKGDKWFNEVYHFFNGFARVKLKGEGWNYINTQGELLWKEYKCFDEISYFCKGFAIVKVKGRGWNFINTNGELVWKGDKWFDTVYNFHEEFAEVKIEGIGWNFINTNGELLWKQYKCFDEVDYFSNGLARVYKEGQGWNFINTKGELLWSEYKNYDKVYNFIEGFVRVGIKGRGWNFINTKGELLWKGDKWFNEVSPFYEEFARVYIRGRGWNFINTQGELLWKEDKWFDGIVGYFSNGFANVHIEDKMYKLNTKGELIEI